MERGPAGLGPGRQRLGGLKVKTRIVLLDSLRGLAVLGILLCSALDFTVTAGLAASVRHWPHGTGADTVSVWVATQWQVQRQFVTLFAMLFGVSISPIGGERSEVERGTILRKRLIWMVVFGLLHGFALWFGDVLLSYAVAGFLVLFARSRVSRRLFKIWIGYWIGFSRLMASGMAVAMLMPHDAPKEAAQTAKEAATNSAAAAQHAGTFMQSLIQNARDRLPLLAGEPVIVMMTGSLMVIGLCRFKTGVLTAETSKKTFVILTLVGLMAFTNYLAPSFIMTARFCGGRGLSQHGKVDRPGLALIVVAIWIVQILWSKWWMDRFSMGLLHWFWFWFWRWLCRGPTPILRSRARA